MGTVYSSVCGCLTSAPEPDLCDFASGHEYEISHDKWEVEWNDEVLRHHAYCCQQVQEEQRYGGKLLSCVVGSDSTCPHVQQLVLV